MIKLSQPKIPESAIERVSEILRSGQLVHGEECESFEQELASFLGVKHALVVSNGTAALHLALLALDIGVGDAVIVPDFTFAATANIVEMTGAKAIIVDVDIETYNMDSELLESCIQSWSGPEKLKAIMPVLEFGNPHGLKKYHEIANKYSLALIEDAACALGAKEQDVMVGTVGDMGCFSFHPRKTLTTGEGGALVTNNEQLYEKAKLLRSHGMIRGEFGIEFKCIGLNYRLTNFQAAIGRAILPKLNGWIERRRELAAIYENALAPLEQQGLIRLPKVVEGHSVQTYMIVLSKQFNRTEVMKALKDSGIESSLGAQSMSELKLFNHANNIVSDYHVGPDLYKNGLALPLHESLNEEQVSEVIRNLVKLIKRCTI